MTIYPLLKPNRVILYLYAVGLVRGLSKLHRFINPTKCWTWSRVYFVHKDWRELG